MTSFTVLPGQLNSHAEQVGGFAGRAETAAQAANHVMNLNDAYGPLAAATLAPKFQEPQQAMAQALAGLVGRFKQISEQLRETVKAYQETDQRQQDALREQQDELSRTTIPPIVGGAR